MVVLHTVCMLCAVHVPLTNEPLTSGPGSRARPSGRPCGPQNPAPAQTPPVPGYRKPRQARRAAGAADDRAHRGRAGHRALHRHTDRLAGRLHHRGARRRRDAGRRHRRGWVARAGGCAGAMGSACANAASTCMRSCALRNRRLRWPPTAGVPPGWESRRCSLDAARLITPPPSRLRHPRVPPAPAGREVLRDRPALLIQEQAGEGAQVTLGAAQHSHAYALPVPVPHTR